MAYQVDLSKIEYMSDYIEHLKYARDRLMETYIEVYKHSRFVADEVWQDVVSERFMDVLDQKETEMRAIAEALDHNQEVMTSQLEELREMAQQQVN